MILIIILSTIASWYIWNVIHEMSHILAAQTFGKVKSWEIKPYPHKYNGNFRFAGAYWTWEEEPRKEHRAFISLAPRFPNLVAAALLTVSCAFPHIMVGLLGAIHPPIMIFLIAGMIDLFVGSFGLRKNSDLRKAAANLNVSPWMLRIPGFIIFLLPLIAVLL